MYKFDKGNWIKRDQLDVTCFIISLFNAQHVSDVNTSILRSLRLICWVISWVVLIWFDVCWCHVVVWLGWCGICIQAEALVFLYLMLNMFRMLIYPSSGCCDLFVELFHGLYCSGLMCVGVTSCFGCGGVVSVWRLKHYSKEIIKQVTSIWSLFIQVSRWRTVQYT